MTRSSDQLGPEETRRYGRHLVLPDVGVEGQLRLKNSRVLVIGAGGLGSPAALYLAAAGVGTLGIADFDRVDETNLQRQILYSSADVGRPKVEAAFERLRGVNPHVEVVRHDLKVAVSNALDLIRSYDVVVDGSDNFSTRYLVNDACVLARRPNVFGSIFRFEGQVSVFGTADGPCYRCLFPEPPPAGTVPSCAEAGVLGVLPGVVGSLQANEVIKLLLERGSPLVGRLLLFDALKCEFREMSLPKDRECSMCGPSATRTSLEEYEEVCEPRVPASGIDITPRELAEWMNSVERPNLLDVRTPMEVQICRFEGASWIPMHELPTRWQELDAEERLVVHCHHGQRSAHVVAFLKERGFTEVWNLAGGIDRWSRDVDPSVPRY